MSNIIKLKRGLDIKLLGSAEKKIVKLPLATHYAVTPSDYVGVTPKLLVKAGDAVKAGTPLFFNKNKQEVLFVSPVSGTVEAVNRGDKRKILEVVVTPSPEQEYEQFEIKSLASASKEDVVGTLLSAGLWPMIIQRPFGVIANPTDAPKAIFVSGFESSPLAPDMEFVLEGEKENLQKGVDVLKKLTAGKVHIGVPTANGMLSTLTGVEVHQFQGPHPAGNVGVQIHHVDPINKGEVVWTVDVQNLAIIGRLFNNGKVDMRKTIAVAGSEVKEPKYVSVISGTPIEAILPSTELNQENVRIINGNVLSGVKVEKSGYIGFYNNLLSVIAEGNNFELFGWAMPRFGKFSVSHSYFSWLMPCKRYKLDTNVNGGHRPFVLSGLYEKYLPMDVYPVYLIKAVLANDFDKMENLGIYEVVEEDLALCEFVDPSKTEMQQILRDGINTMIKELN